MSTSTADIKRALPLLHDWLGLDRFAWAALGVAAVMLFYQLLVPPIVGLADNGDYERIMTPVGLKHAATSFEDKFFRYANVKYAFVAPGNFVAGYISSEVLLAGVARVVGSLITRDGLFDIRILGALHALLLLSGLALILSAARGLHVITRCVLALLLVLMFTDVGYVVLFNTFYSQTASLLFLLLATGCAALLIRTGGRHRSALAGFAIAAALFITAKPQEAVLALPLAVFALRAMWLTGSGRAKAQGALLAVGLLLCGGWYLLQAPTYLRQGGLYLSVFCELLPNSPDPSADLEALGVSGKLACYSGASTVVLSSPFFQPWFQEAFFAKVDQSDLLLFYLTHPQRFWQLLTRSAANAFTLKSDKLGQFTKSSGLPPVTVSSSFRLWSDFKQRALPGSPWALLILFGSNLAAVVLLRWRRRGAAPERLGLEAFGLLNMMALGAFLVCTLSLNLADQIRQLFTFHALTDLCILGVVAWLVEAGARRSHPPTATAPPPLG